MMSVMAKTWMRTYGPAVLVAAVLGYLLMYLQWPSVLSQVDLQVYRFGAERVLAGADLYSIGLTGNPKTLLFDYTPFAALCSIPLALVTTTTAQIFGLVSNVALLGFVVHRSLRRLGMTAATGLWGLGALLLGLVLWLEPVRLSLQLGQVNLIILAVVVFDLLGPSGRRWAGVGIGLVAGVKLTPALFIVFLVLIGRRRQAIVAAVTFAATVALGFVVLPKDSVYFWLKGGFNDVSRITSDPIANTSLRGLFIRLHDVGVPATLATGVLAVVALSLAVLAWRRGHAVLALAITGMATSALSPFSWSHHWIWLAPLLVHLGYRAFVLGGRWSLVALGTFWVAFAGWLVKGNGDTPEMSVLAFRPGGAWDVAIPAAYLAGFAAVLLGTAWWLVRSRVDDYEMGTTTGGELYPETRTQLAGGEPAGTDARRSTVSPGKTVT